MFCSIKGAQTYLTITSFLSTARKQGIDAFEALTSAFNGKAEYADIIFKSKRRDKVVIIEIKTCSGNESKKAKAREALSQIEAKNYAKTYLDDEDVSLVYTYGISFIRKDCDVIVKRLK